MIKKIQNEISEIQISLRELEVLEDYKGVDYSEILQDCKWIKFLLNDRLKELRVCKK